MIQKLVCLIDEYDHITLLNKKDSIVKAVGKKEKLMIVDFNPTSENIAKDLWHKIQYQYPKIKDLKVTVYEGFKGIDYTPSVTYGK